MQQKIPKIIHYCWFGGKPIPKKLEECINTWSVLEGYTVMRWDESNCSFDENEFIKKAYNEGRYGFSSDYYRLKALYEYGGIYLDTDVVVNKLFDDILTYPVFLGFIFDCTVGTAIIGAEKNNQFIKNILNMYEKTSFTDEDIDFVMNWKNGKLVMNKFEVNNYYFTKYILDNYPSFKLNNKFQNMKDFVIFPKEYFETGMLSKKHYTIHLCDGEWRNGDSGSRIKQLLKDNYKIYIRLLPVIRKYRYKKLMKTNPFYPDYLKHKAGRR